MRLSPQVELTNFLIISLSLAAIAYAIPDSGNHLHSGHSSTPLLELNETEILEHHAPDPLSYYAHDYLQDERGYSSLMILHGVGMLFAYWILLPIVIALRIANHSLKGPLIVAFQVAVTLSWFGASLYNKLTPNLYQHSSHGQGGFVILAITGLLPLYDGWHFIKSLLSAIRSAQPLTIKNVYSAWSHPSAAPHYSNLPQHPNSDFNDSPRTTLDESNSEYTYEFDEKHHHHHHHQHDEVRHGRRSTFNLGRFLFISLERSLVIAAFVQLLSGIAVYSGSCRGNYLNGCLAHLIKGGIFWAYGIASFARFLGAYAELGWAWNSPIENRGPSFEFVECLIIFIYGISNTWMERFGAESGSPFTTKQIQHISIAVMFWFGGLVGMAIESRRFKRWLGAAVYHSAPSDSHVSEPPSYHASFNPFPAIIIGVTGAAMSAHHQTYLFQVKIHALWGYFLVGFAIIRSLSYFLLWLRPPKSPLPSRPPTEAVSSFLLACGGLTFMFSTEQVTFAAMRSGHDDMMMFLNLAVAITLLAFCWLVLLLSFKGWLIARAPLRN